MVEKIKSLLLAGKSVDEAQAEVIEENEDVTAEELAEATEKALKLVEVKKFSEKKEAEKKEKAAIDAKVERALEEKLKSIKLPFSLEQEAKSAGIEVSENEFQWKKDAGRLIKLLATKDKTDEQIKEMHALSQKSRNILNDGASMQKLGQKYGVKAPSDPIRGDDGASGGYFIRPEFDMEVDRLTYEQSALLNAIRVRPGGEKTEINSIGTFDFSFRTDQKTDFTELGAPTFSTQEVLYRQAGGIMPVANSVLQESEYNLMDEIMMGAVDARIRLLEPLVCTGRVTTSLDPFNGIWFTPGVQTADAADVTKIQVVDLEALEELQPAQNRQAPGWAFIMPFAQAQTLANQKAEDGHYLGAVQRNVATGQYTYMGRPIIIVDTNVHTLTKTAKTGGQMYFVALAHLPRFRMYQRGGVMRVDTSNEYYFASDATAIRFIIDVKQGIPTNSTTSFIRLAGIEA